MIYTITKLLNRNKAIHHLTNLFGADFYQNRKDKR